MLECHWELANKWSKTAQIVLLKKCWYSSMEDLMGVMKTMEKVSGTIGYSKRQCNTCIANTGPQTWSYNLMHQHNISISFLRGLSLIFQDPFQRARERLTPLEFHGLVH
jgi:hypothetical protein